MVFCQVVVETGVTGRGLVTLSSVHIDVKPLICRDWGRKLLVRRPQTTQFCPAVKRLNCTFFLYCLSAVWYYWWSLVPRNKVEAVIAQSDEFDSSHQGKCWFPDIIGKNSLFLQLTFLFIRPSFYLLFIHSRCAHVHYACFAEHVVHPQGVFHVNILGTSNVFKILPRGNTWPSFTLQQRIGAYARMMSWASIHAAAWSNPAHVQACTCICSANWPLKYENLLLSARHSLQRICRYNNRGTIHCIERQKKVFVFQRSRQAEKKTGALLLTSCSCSTQRPGTSSSGNFNRSTDKVLTCLKQESTKHHLSPVDDEPGFSRINLADRQAVVFLKDNR